MFVRRLAALHIQGLGGIKVLDWMKKQKQKRRRKYAMKTNTKNYLPTVAPFTFRNCNKDLWEQ